MVPRASINPDVIQERIVRVQAELRLAEAEARDRAKYFPQQAENARRRHGAA